MFSKNLSIGLIVVISFVANCTENYSSEDDKGAFEAFFDKVDNNDMDGACEFIGDLCQVMEGRACEIEKQYCPADSSNPLAKPDSIEPDSTEPANPNANENPITDESGTADNSRSAIFINLGAEPSYHHTAQVFVDVMKQAGSWRSNNSSAISQDSNGWVTQLQANQTATTYIIWDSHGHYAKGEYTLSWEGKGTFVIDGDVKQTVQSTAPGSIKINLSGNQGLLLKITQTDPKDYLRNISVVMPGHAITYRAEPWNPAFLSFAKNFGGFRFMDWHNTNNSKIKSWQERTNPLHRTYFRGYSPSTNVNVPYEYSIDLCNRLKRHGWWNIPHQANDDFVKNLLELIKKKLDPSLKVYIEYSNETWNGMFDQNKYVNQKGVELGLDSNQYSAGFKYHGYRAAQIFDLVDKVFGSEKDRVVKVIAGQAGNAWVAEQALKQSSAGQKASALAIAPYFGGQAGAAGNAPEPSDVKNWSNDKLFQWLKDTAIPTSMDWVVKHKKLADQYGIDLIAYEGGQHLVGVSQWVNDQALTDRFISMNRDSRMKELYLKYLDGWKANGGRIFAAFSAIYYPNKWGSWGILEYLGQPETTAPKYAAIIQWLKQNPIWW